MKRALINTSKIYENQINSEKVRAYEMSSKKSFKTMVFEQKVPAKAAELPKCPRNVISDDYRLIPLRRRKFEVIPVLDHDFRGHQSWEDWDLGEIGDFVKDSYVKDM